MLFFASLVILALGWVIYRSIQLPKEVKKALQSQGQSFDAEFDFRYSKVLFDYSSKTIAFIRCTEFVSFFRRDDVMPYTHTECRDSVIASYQEVVKVTVGLVSTKEPTTVQICFHLAPSDTVKQDPSVRGYSHMVWVLEPALLFEKNARVRLGNILDSELGLAIEESEMAPVDF